jgi:hypothetical protein
MVLALVTNNKDEIKFGNAIIDNAAVYLLKLCSCSKEYKQLMNNAITGSLLSFSSLSVWRDRFEVRE